MKVLNVTMLGAIAMSCLVAGMFFVRFWQHSRDRFFALFAASFFVEAANRVALALSPNPNDGAPVIYLVRFLSYLLILVAIVEKNRGSAAATIERAHVTRVAGESEVRH